MEALRVLWEDPDSEEAEELLNNGAVVVNLLDSEGNQRPNFQLIIGNGDDEDDENERLDLQEIIASRIEMGIKGFFIAMKEAFSNGTHKYCGLFFINDNRDLSSSDLYEKLLSLNLSLFISNNAFFRNFLSSPSKSSELSYGFLKNNSPSFSLYKCLKTLT